MRKTKLLVLLLAVCMMLSVLTACGSKGDTADKTAATATESGKAETAAADTSADSEKKAEDGKKETDDASASEATAAAEEKPAKTASGTQKDILYYCYQTTPYVTLDPSTEFSNGIMTLQNVYETLTYYNAETKEVEPLLAESWTSSEDGLSWVFKLREDVTFHSGAKMTAADVVASMNRTLELGQGAAYIWDAVESVEATGDYEVTVKCSYSAPVDLIASAGYAAYVIGPEAIDKDTDWFNQGNDDGTGPYRIAKATGDSVVLTAFEDYRGGWTDKQFKNVMVQEVSESGARRQLLETGEAQLSSDMSSTDLAALREETDKVSIYKVDSFNNILMFFNTATEPCSNADFRRALQYAFPYEEAVNGVMDGNAAVSHGLVPSGLWGHSDDVLQYTCDLEKAKECLEASGVDVNNLSLTVTFMTGTDEYSSILQIYQANLKKLGISLELRSMEWDEQWADAQATNPEDRQDMFVMVWWPDYASPNSWFEVLMHSEDTVTYNLAYLNDPEIDSKIEEASVNIATNRDRAAELYVEIQQEVMEQAYILPMYDQSRTYVVSNQITGVYENPAYSTVVNFYNVNRAD